MVVSLKKISKRLHYNQSWLKGRAEGMGIRLDRVGTALVMSEADYGRLVESLRADGYEIPEPASASA